MQHSTERARYEWIAGQARNDEVRLLLFVIPGSTRYPWPVSMVEVALSSAQVLPSFT